MKNITFDFEKIKLLYIRNKKLMVPLLIIFVCIVLFFEVIVPGIGDYLDSRKEVDATRQRIEVLKTNLSVLSKISNTDQTSNLLLVSKALPTEKDFAAVLQAISKSSISSGTELGDFTFQVGELSTASATPGRSSLSLVLALRNTDVSSMQRFLTDFSKTLPISEVSEVNINNSLSNVSAAFYYRPLTQTKLDYTIPLIPLSATEMELLKTLSSWSVPQSSIPSPSPSSSQSAF